MWTTKRERVQVAKFQAQATISVQRVTTDRQLWKLTLPHNNSRQSKCVASDIPTFHTPGRGKAEVDSKLSREGNSTIEEYRIRRSLVSCIWPERAGYDNELPALFAML